MPVIYFDNFRGFKSTFLDLKEVNFFVGENSTGKTSVLKLIGIISSQGFWRYGEFGKDETSLGGFSDIITSTRESKDYFEIGILGSNSENVNVSAIRLRYIEKDNFPFLKEICFRTGLVNIQAILEGKVIKYRFNILKSNSSLTLENFRAWITNNELNDIPFLRVEVEYLGIIPILTQLRSILSDDLSKETRFRENSLALIMEMPSYLNPFAWIAPVRAQPQRIYNHQGLIYSSEGRHSASVLKEILLGPSVKSILNRFGTDSGLYDDITIRDLSEDGSETNTFELLVYINGVPRNIMNVGYGVSQILPIIIEAIAREDNTWFATQQPEVHLHPRAQAALGDFIFKSNSIDKQKFIIETHSDYTIDRYRLRLNRSLRAKDKKIGIGQVIFFSKSDTGNKLDVIEFNEDGSYPEDQPKEFRDFFIKEQLELITI